MNKTNILIVDDHIENITALAKLIEADDVRVISAQSAEQALNLLINHNFALALLDVQMPGMTGFDLARLIRGVKKFRNLPVIFVTAQQSSTSFIFEGYETGAVDLLFKPLDPHVVRSKVRVFVQLDQQARQLQTKMAEVEQLRRDAEDANMAKSRFLANMSHEIRTPLTAVLGFAEVLGGQAGKNPELTHCTDAIQRNGTLLLKIIDDILDLSKVEAQRLEVENIDFNLAETLRDVGAALDLKAQEKGIALEFPIPPEARGTYCSDPIRIKQILLNIVGNAIKFTSQGSVKVKVEVSAGDGGGTSRKLHILVSDTGVGLTTEQVKRLFHPFSQADSSTRRNYGGTGLGLSIAQHLARALGGDVKLLKSAAGQGSEFEITIGLEKVVEQASELLKARPEKSSSTADWKDKSVLVVDDSDDNRMLIELYLRSTGVNVIQADSGLEAIESVKRHAPDVILMDVQMPMMDGHEATRAIRKLGFDRPIIAFTAHAMREEAERCKQAGCDSVLTKPVSRQDLMNQLGQYL